MTGKYIEQMAAIAEKLPNKDLELAQGAGEALAALLCNDQLVDHLRVTKAKDVDEKGWFTLVGDIIHDHLEVNMLPENQGVIRLTQVQGKDTPEQSIYKLMSPTSITQGMNEPRTDRIFNLTNLADSGKANIFARVSPEHFNMLLGVPGEEANHTYEETLIHNPGLLVKFNGGAVMEQARQHLGISE